MITFIIGAVGAGKTALATYFLKHSYETEGTTILRHSRMLIEQAAKEEGRYFTLPDKVPFYTNYKVNLHVGYKRYFEPYFINPYYFNIQNAAIATQFIAPGSTLVFDEAQRIFDARQSATFSSWSSYAFEIHRQAKLKMYLIAQRGMLLDRNIKELGVHVIYVLGMENETNEAKIVTRSTWHCREFDEWAEAEKFLRTGEGRFEETMYTNEGNIFESFNSYVKIKEFLPPKGMDFDYLSFEKPATLTERQATFYKTGEPKEFRSPPKPPETEKEKKTA